MISTYVRNILTNSIKFSANGCITLYARKDINGNILLGCKDLGKGMDPIFLENLLSDRYTGNSLRKDSFRIGYILIKEIVKLLDAKLIIESSLENGTDVYIILNNYEERPNGYLMP